MKSASHFVVKTVSFFIASVEAFIFCLASDIDYCSNASCKNGASCVDGMKNYTCSCVVGYTGDQCETGISGLSQRHSDWFSLD